MRKAEPPHSLVKLRAGDRDISVAFHYQAMPTVDASRLQVTPLLEDEMEVVLPANHPWARRQSIAPGDLSAERWIAGCPRCRATFVYACAEAGLEPDIVFTTHDNLAVQSLVVAGIRVAVMPSLVRSFLQHPRLVGRPLRPAMRRSVAAYTLADYVRVPAANVMRKMPRESVAEIAPWRPGYRSLDSQVQAKPWRMRTTSAWRRRTNVRRVDAASLGQSLLTDSGGEMAMTMEPNTRQPNATVRRCTGLEELVAMVRDVLVYETDPARIATEVAQRLRPFLGRQDLLLPEQTKGDAAGYRQHVLHAEDDGSLSVVSLVWLPGQATPIHDHVSWCVVGVHQGTEAETRYRVATCGDRQVLVPTSTVTNSQYSTCGFAPPGDIHQVRNVGEGKTISLHVYGADIRRLGSSVRREYRMPVQPPSHDGASRHVPSRGPRPL